MPRCMSPRMAVQEHDRRPGPAVANSQFSVADINAIKLETVKHAWSDPTRAAAQRLSVMDLDEVVVDSPIGVNLASTVSRRRLAFLSIERPRALSLTVAVVSPAFLIDLLAEATSSLLGRCDLACRAGLAR
jgi:hypothetical protein